MPLENHLVLQVAFSVYEHCNTLRVNSEDRNCGKKK